MKKEKTRHQIETIVDLYDSGLMSFREIWEREDINLPMTTVRIRYLKEKGKHKSERVKRFDKMEDLDMEYVEARRQDEEDRRKLESLSHYW